MRLYTEQTFSLPPCSPARTGKQKRLMRCDTRVEFGKVTVEAGGGCESVQ